MKKNLIKRWERLFIAVLGLMNYRGIFETFISCKEITPRDRAILEARFGLKSDTPLTLQETAKKFGVTRERIRQIEAKALERIRENLLKI